jgi:quinol monooxygenase YgiN
MSDTTISPGATVITLITTFTCAEQRQNELVAALDVATTEILVHQPGFISTNMHASLDKTRVVNYAQWASMEELDDLQNNRQVQQHMASIMAIAESVDPRLFEVRSVHHV